MAVTVIPSVPNGSLLLSVPYKWCLFFSDAGSRKTASHSSYSVPYSRLLVLVAVARALNSALLYTYGPSGPICLRARTFFSLLIAVIGPSIRFISPFYVYTSHFFHIPRPARHRLRPVRV